MLHHQWLIAYISLRGHSNRVSLAWGDRELTKKIGQPVKLMEGGLSQRIYFNLSYSRFSIKANVKVRNYFLDKQLHFMGRIYKHIYAYLANRRGLLKINLGVRKCSKLDTWVFFESETKNVYKKEYRIETIIGYSLFNLFFLNSA